jgi:hypothetical protein
MDHVGPPDHAPIFLAITAYAIPVTKNPFGLSAIVDGKLFTD